jgi:predicted SnoaL-like aldol condensation-catalyzing enzyme
VIKLTVLRVDGALADFKLRSMHVIVHGRLSNTGPPVNWIAADVLRLKDGILVEHWDVIQDEATKQQSKSGNPMFGDSFPK